MNLHLVDIDPLVVFRGHPEVKVSDDNILRIASNTLVSPGNSLGFMDGGIDAEYVNFFGLEIQTRVQNAISRREDQTLPVGASLVVQTGHSKIPYLIVAPTMESPEFVPSENAYRAMRAILRVANQQPDVGELVFCPGLTTNVGGVNPKDAALAMAEAYAVWKTLT